MLSLHNETSFPITLHKRNFKEYPRKYILKKNAPKMIRFTNMSSIWNDITKMVVLDAEITRGDIRFFSDKIDGNPLLFRGQR